jgi:hypothetical protein
MPSHTGTAAGILGLHNAIQDGDEQRLKALLAAGVDPNPDDDVHSPLHRAAELGHTKIIPLLIKAGAEPDSFDERGTTVLGTAIDAKQRGSVQALLDNGLTLRAPDFPQWIKRARSRGADDVADLLAERQRQIEAARTPADEISDLFARPDKRTTTEDRLIALISTLDPQAAKTAVEEGRNRDDDRRGTEGLPKSYPRALAVLAKRLDPDDPIAAAAFELGDAHAVAELVKGGHKPRTDEPLLWAVANADCVAIRALGKDSPPLRLDPERFDDVMNPDAVLVAADRTLRPDARVAAWLAAAQYGFADNQPCPPIPEALRESVAAFVEDLSDRPDVMRVLASVAAATEPQAVDRDRLAGDVEVVAKLLTPLHREHDPNQQHRQLAARGATLSYDRDAQQWIASRDQISVAVPALAEVAEQEMQVPVKAKEPVKRSTPTRMATPKRERKLEMPGI